MIAFVARGQQLAVTHGVRVDTHFAALGCTEMADDRQIEGVDSQRARVLEASYMMEMISVTVTECGEQSRITGQAKLSLIGMVESGCSLQLLEPSLKVG